jgi:hypothetical protein
MQPTMRISLGCSTAAFTLAVGDVEDYDSTYPGQKQIALWIVGIY